MSENLNTIQSLFLHTCIQFKWYVAQNAEYALSKSHHNYNQYSLSRGIYIYLVYIFNIFLILHHRSRIPPSVVNSWNYPCLVYCFTNSKSFKWLHFSAGKTTTSDVVNNRSLHASYNWMAPEIMAGLPPCENSDLYSIASVMWELINGIYLITSVYSS